MHLATLAFLATATVWNADCSDGPVAPAPTGDVDVAQSNLNGAYRYLAYDSAGALLLDGQLVLNPVDDSTVSGTWAIEWAPGADTQKPVGPQVGAGTLRGTRTSDGWDLTLTPDWADNNVDLVGSAKKGRFAGQWTHSTISGPFSGGSFEAVRQ